MLIFMHALLYNSNMIVTKVVLHNYRNYRDQTVSFDPALTVIQGANGSGKTNLIESIYLCSVGKSPRSVRDKELIRFGEDEAHITLWVQKKYRTHRIDVHLQTNGAKRVAIDGVGITRLADLMGILNVIFFSPDELKIVKEDPQCRRRFINISLCQQNKHYFATLAKYNKLLDNRNALLKSALSLPDLTDQVAVWNWQLAQEGAKLIAWRQDFVQALQTIADPIHRAIAGEDCDLTLRYDTCAQGATIDELAADLLRRLNDSLPHDMVVRYTTVGPHRDDIRITANGIELKAYGSQGQQRTAALAIKLAEIAYFERHTGERPVLLLDDVLSELDSRRREALLQATDGIQTLLTCTEFPQSDYAVGSYLQVDQGHVTTTEPKDN